MATSRQDEGQIICRGQLWVNTPNPRHWTRGKPQHAQLNTSTPTSTKAKVGTMRVLRCRWLVSKPSSTDGKEYHHCWTCLLVVLPTTNRWAALPTPYLIDTLKYFANFLDEISIKHVYIYHGAFWGTSRLNCDLLQHWPSYVVKSPSPLRAPQKNLAVLEVNPRSIPAANSRAGLGNAAPLVTNI